MDEWTVGPDGAIAPVYRLQQVLQARLGGIGACRNIHNGCPVTLEAVNDQLGRRRERIPRQQVVKHQRGQNINGVRSQYCSVKQFWRLESSRKSLIYIDKFLLTEQYWVRSRIIRSQINFTIRLTLV